MLVISGCYSSLRQANCLLDVCYTDHTNHVSNIFSKLLNYSFKGTVRLFIVTQAAAE